MKWFLIIYLEFFMIKFIKSNFWSAHPFNLIKTNFINVSENCKSHINELENEVKRYSQWAVQMNDATCKLQSGLLMGNTISLGNFEECLMSKHPLNKFTGKYCLLNLQLNKLEQNQSFAWENLLKIAAGRNIDPRFKEEPQIIKNIPIRLSSYWGICVPSSCSTKDVLHLSRESLNRFESEVSQIIKVTVSKDNCSTEKSANSFNLLDYLALIIFVATIIVLFVSTFYSRYLIKKNKYSRALQILHCFCIVDNWKDLVAVSEKNIFNYFDGFRVILVTGVVMWHNFSLYAYGNNYNNVEILKLYYNNFYAFFLYSEQWIDTFFLISGFLRSHYLIDKYKKGNFELLKPIIGRYLRSAGPLLWIIIFHISILPKLGSGPLWNEIMRKESSRCSKLWLYSILYIGNFVSTFGCIPQTWTLCVDFHLFIIAPLIVYPLWKYYFRGKIVMILAVIISIVIPFGITFWRKLPGVFQPLNNNSLELKLYYVWIYCSTFSRMTPYFLGIFLEAILCKREKMKISKWLQTFGWLISFALLVACVYGGKELPPLPSNSYERWITSFYAGFHRFAWSIAVGWIIYICHSGNGGILNDILSSKIFHILGKLSFSVFITNYEIGIYYMASARTQKEELAFTSMKECLGLMLIIFFVSLIFYICIEAPFARINNILLKQEVRVTTHRNIKRGVTDCL